jgi:nickel/cobalt transporter (NicO) family protein
LFVLVVAASPAGAHPLGNFTINRFSALEVSTTDVVVRYVVDMAEIPTLQELPSIDTDGDRDVGEGELESYAAQAGRRLLGGVALQAGRRSIDLSLRASTAELGPGQAGLDVLRIEATFRGPLPSRQVELIYEDRNYTKPQKLGWKEIVAYAVDGQGVVSSSVPSESISNGLTSYPKDLLSNPLDVVRARMEVAPGAGAGAPAREDQAGSGAAPRTEDAFASLIERELSPGFFLFALVVAFGFGALHALGPGHGKTVMAAYLVGGRARVADAAAIGIAVSLMHTASVVVLGVVTLGASSLFEPEAVYPWLSLSAGAVVLGLGVWLLSTRVSLYTTARGRPRRHSHVRHDGGRPSLSAAGFERQRRARNVSVGGRPAGLHGGHDRVDTPGSGAEQGTPIHAHDGGLHGSDRRPPSVHGGVPAAGVEPSAEPRDDHPQAVVHSHGLFSHSHDGPEEALRSSPMSWRGLGAVALSGGLLPSPTALVVLLGAVALHRVAFGISLVAAFSVGLAAALTALGVLVLRARSLAVEHLGRRAGALLPLLSAAGIVAVGLYLTVRAITAF